MLLAVDARPQPQPLPQVLEAHLDPLLDSASSQQPALPRPPLPVFSLPRTVSATLPGGQVYLNSRLPSATAKTGELVSMVTGGPETGSVCVVKVDVFGLIVEIAYLGAERLEGRNVGRLVGWHESFLNNACFTYECGQVADWVQFFREPWAALLYHDNFTAFAGSLREALQVDKGMFLINDKILEVAQTCSDDGLLSLERRKIVGNRGENVPEGAKRTIEALLLDFLRRHGSDASFRQIQVPAGSITTSGASRPSVLAVMTKK